MYGFFKGSIGISVSGPTFLQGLNRTLYAAISFFYFFDKYANIKRSPPCVLPKHSLSGADNKCRIMSRYPGTKFPISVR